MELTPIVAGNWKMHKTPKDGHSFVEKTTNLLLEINHVSVIFAPPFTGLFDIDVNPPFYLAAQNCHWEEQGAYTGEISVAMIRDCSAEYVILGHSERRHVFGETDNWINRKVIAVLAGGLKPILCIGETLDQREAGETDLVLKNQLEQGLAEVESLQNIVIAYEPVWSIGTGIVPSYKELNNTMNWQMAQRQHEKFLVWYRNQAWELARKWIDDLRNEFNGVMVGYYDMMEKRIDQLEKEGLPDDWDGVYRATTK